MSLDRRKLELVRELAGGGLQARCPACAESGHDRKGEHLRVYPDGRFGCCVHPKDTAHRRRIFALAGERQIRALSSRAFTVRVAAVAVGDGTGCSVVESLRTLRTGISDSVTAVQSRTAADLFPEEAFRTLRTPFLKSRACAREEEREELPASHMCKDSESAVLSVLAGESAGSGERLPYFTASGNLVIPLDSPERFHWWKGRQSIEETAAEVRSWAAKEKDHGTGV